MADVSIKECLGEIRHLRNELRIKFRDMIASREPTDPATLTFTVACMLETRFDPTFIGNLVGTSRTSVMRWGDGQNVPRSPGYRKWVVEAILAHLKDVIEHDEPSDHTDDQTLPEPPIGVSYEHDEQYEHIDDQIVKLKTSTKS